VIEISRVHSISSVTALKLGRLISFDHDFAHSESAWCLDNDPTGLACNHAAG
jgi:hypothetical protein